MLISVTAGFVYKISIIMGLFAAGLAFVLVYLNLPMLFLLRQLPLVSHPLPRLSMLFWLGMFNCFKIPKAALVYFNNRVTGKMAVRPENVHVLVSRCLQNSACRQDVTSAIHNCRECGACKIGAIKAICRSKGVSVTVESGGTSARRLLAQRQPKLVIAVACERELLAGIMDTPLPVVGVVLQVGPTACTNSDVKIPEFEERMNCAVKEA